MEIRKAGDGDAEIWNRLVFAVKSEDLPGLFRMTKPIDLESSKLYLDSILATRGSFALLALDEGRVIGSIDCLRRQRPEEAHSAELGLCVLKEKRGQGIGGALIDACVDTAKAEGLIKKLELEVFDNNPVAIELYRKHGFSEEGRRKKSILKNGVYIDVILMGMWLD